VLVCSCQSAPVRNPFKSALFLHFVQILARKCKQKGTVHSLTLKSITSEIVKTRATGALLLVPKISATSRAHELWQNQALGAVVLRLLRMKTSELTAKSAFLSVEDFSSKQLSG
jgi:hypothetical protein